MDWFHSRRHGSAGPVGGRGAFGLRAGWRIRAEDAGRRSFGRKAALVVESDVRDVAYTTLARRAADLRLMHRPQWFGKGYMARARSCGKLASSEQGSLSINQRCRIKALIGVLGGRRALRMNVFFCERATTEYADDAKQELGV